MKNFFGNLTFSRAIILLSFLGSLVLGYMLYTEKQKLSNYDAGVAYADQAVPKIVTRARELDELIKAAAREDFSNDVNAVETYVRERALDPNVHVGQMDMSKPKTEVIFSGGPGGAGGSVRDTIFSVTPSSAGKSEFTRSEIANFAYLLEQDSRRMKISRLMIRPTQKNIKEDQSLEDRWDFELDLRIRSRSDG
jgi:hypothetical protein